MYKHGSRADYVGAERGLETYYVGAERGLEIWSFHVANWLYVEHDMFRCIL